MKAREKLREVALVGLGGFTLLAIVLFCPNGSGGPAYDFFQTAHATRWGHLLDWPAVWCSFKIILFSLSLFVLIDALATLLLVLNRRRLATKAFVLMVVPFLGFFAGTYYLLKSLL